MRYPIVVHKDSDGDYRVTVPDLPGCLSAGGTIEETFAMAKEAIEGHIETLLMDNKCIPEQRPFEEHMANPDYKGGAWVFIDVDLAKLNSKTVRVNITLPERVLGIVDELAKRSGESRSGYLARIAVEAAHPTHKDEEQPSKRRGKLKKAGAHP